MTNKGRKQSTRKVKNLKVKSLSADKAKKVKGGTDNAGATDEHRKFSSS